MKAKKRKTRAEKIRTEKNRTKKNRARILAERTQFAENLRGQILEAINTAEESNHHLPYYGAFSLVKALLTELTPEQLAESNISFTLRSPDWDSCDDFCGHVNVSAGWFRNNIVIRF